MKDGVAKSTGNSRYLRGAGWPATYEEFRQLAAEGKLPFDLADINPEGWAVLGDALNKANLLPDDVCALLGLPSTAVPKDGIREAYGRIGEIKASTRATLGDDWALCNGDTITTAEAPELCPMLLPSFTGAWEAGTSEAAPIDYINGYFVRWSGNTLQYARTLEGLWSQTTISVGGTNPVITDIAYGNGYYVVVGRARQSNGYYFGFAYYATSLGGPWSQGTTGIEISSVTYGNGYFVAVASSEGATYVYYASGTPKTWTSVQISGYTKANVEITFVNGYFVGIFSYARRGIFYATNPAGPWNDKELSSSQGSMTLPVYLDGKYISFCTEENRAVIYQATDLSGSWTVVNVTEDAPGLAQSPLLKISGYYVIGDKVGVGYAKSLEGPWRNVNIGITNGHLLKVGDVLVMTTGAQYATVRDGYALPTISVADAYAYIRTK